MAHPSSIAEAFTAVGRDAPPLDACAELARVLDSWNGNLDGLCAHVEAQTGAVYALRRYAPQYRAALREAADPRAWADRLMIEAAERDRWAASADDEATYRAETARTWRLRGDVITAQRYEGEADSNRRFARHCRETAAEKRAQAEALGRKVAA